MTLRYQVSWKAGKAKLFAALLPVLFSASLIVSHLAVAAPIAGEVAPQPSAIPAALTMAATPIPVDSSVKLPITVDLFAQPLSFRGTLGDATIEMHLQLKPDPTEGLQGTYSAPGQSAKILLAGEYDGGDVIMEESINGKDVSGEWAGKFDGKTFSGTWSTTDDAVIKPFVLIVESNKERKKSSKK